METTIMGYIGVRIPYQLFDETPISLPFIAHSGPQQRHQLFLRNVKLVLVQVNPWLLAGKEGEEKSMDRVKGSGYQGIEE